MIELHLVWITKYRKKVLVGDIPLRTRNLLREICEKNDVHIISGYPSSEIFRWIFCPRFASLRA
ncbi:MAG: transposase [Desulfovibrio sp.]|nr:transposase [Desulfovibrio sp.]